MLLFPAIDMFDHKAVRLFKGDYQQMTVYSKDPLSVAKRFEDSGAKWVHLVDLQGAKDGTTPHADLVAGITKETGLQVEIGGGIRSRGNDPSLPGLRRLPCNPRHSCAGRS